MRNGCLKSGGLGVGSSNLPAPTNRINGLGRLLKFRHNDYMSYICQGIQQAALWWVTTLPAGLEDNLPLFPRFDRRVDVVPMHTPAFG